MKKTYGFLITILFTIFIGIKASNALAIPGTISFVTSQEQAVGYKKYITVEAKFTASQTTYVHAVEAWNVRLNTTSNKSGFVYLNDGDFAQRIGAENRVTTDLDGNITGGTFVMKYDGHIVQGEEYTLFTIEISGGMSEDLGGVISPINESYYERSNRISDNRVYTDIDLVLNTDEYANTKSYELIFDLFDGFDKNLVTVDLAPFNSEGYMLKTIKTGNNTTYKLSYTSALSSPRYLRATISYPLSYYYAGQIMNFTFNDYLIDEPSGDSQDYHSTVMFPIYGLLQTTYLEKAHYGFGYYNDYARYNDEEDTYELVLHFDKNPEDWCYMEEHLNNLPNVKGVTGFIEPNTEGVKVTRMTSGNGMYNASTGAFEVDFAGDPEDVVFEVKITDRDAIEDYSELLEGKDKFSISVNDIKYVADGYLADLNTVYQASDFKVLFLEKPIILGDWNDDDEFNLVDVVRYRMYMADADGLGATYYTNLTESKMANLDFNKNEQIDIGDLIYARSVLVGLIHCNGSTCIEVS